MVERLHESVIPLDEVVRSLFLNHGTLTVLHKYRRIIGYLLGNWIVIAASTVTLTGKVAFEGVL